MWRHVHVGDRKPMPCLLTMVWALHHLVACRFAGLIIIIMLVYLYCAAYTRMTMNELSPPCEQRHITFNDDEQRVQLAGPELPAPHYICMYRLLPTTPPSPSRHYYPRLIAGTNLPTPKGWIAWLAKADYMHITLSKVITQLNPKVPEGNEPRLSDPRPTQYQ